MPDNPSDPSPDGAADPEPPSRPSIRERLARLVGRKPVSADDAGFEGAAPSAIRLRLREFETGTVRDVMTSRVDVVAIEEGATLSEVLKLFAAEAHSRMPVYRESMDEPLGFVHIKDVVAELVRAGWSAEGLASRPLARLVREMMYVPESTRLADLLVQMQASRIHIAIVIDEYGGTGGMVCLEDLVEQIVGDIEDEHDETKSPVLRRGRNVWDVDGLTDIEDVERETGLTLAVKEFEDEVDTMGGLVAAIAGRLPQTGDVIEHPGGPRLEVLETDPRRVTRIRVRTAARATPPVLADGGGGGLDRKDA